MSRRLLDGVHVLVVEDEADAREVLAALLGYHGAHVTTAFDAADAMARLQRLRADVILSDLAMPGVTGIEMLARVRALPDQLERRTPAIACSAFTDAETRRSAIKNGFDVFLPKPLDPMVVVREIARLAGRQA